MRIELIETFLDLVATGNFNRTAERLGVTQSTISGRVQALEKALGARLFRRSRLGAELTPGGRRFEPHARVLQQEWTSAQRALAVGSEPGRSLRLGIQQDLSDAFLGELVREIRRFLPDAQLYIELDYSSQMCADLVTGTLDFALIYTPQPHPDIHFHSVGEIPYHMVARDHRQFDDLRAGDMIFGQFSPAFARAHRDLLPELSETILSVGMSGAMLALLQSVGGAGYVMAGQLGRLEEQGLALVEGAPRLTQPAYAAMNLRNRTSGLHRRLAQIVARLIEVYD